MILGYIFLRPFFFREDFPVLVFILDAVFLLSAAVYILTKIKKIAFGDDLLRFSVLKDALRAVVRKVFYTFLYHKNTRPFFPDKFVSLFFLSLILSGIPSAGFGKKAFEIYKYLPFIGLYWTARVSSEEERSKLRIVLMLSAALVSLYGLFHHFSVANFTKEFLSLNPGYPYKHIFLPLKRASYPFLTANLFAAYLAMVIMLALGDISAMVRAGKKGALFFLNTLCASLCVIALFFTKSIGGWLATISSAILFLVLGKMLNKKTASLIFLFLMLFSAVLIMRLKENEEFVRPAYSFQKRLSYWKDTIAVIQEHPLTGAGVGNFKIRSTRAAHNSYLQIWAEAGILGIISYIGIIFLFVKNNVQKLRSGNLDCYRLGVLSAGAAFLFDNLISFSFFVGQAAFLWWILLGLNQADN